MNSPQRTARLAGLLYLLGGLTGPFTLFYIPAVLIVPGNAAATASKIRAFELLLRAGIVSDLACSIIFIFVVLNLYCLLKDVDHCIQATAKSRSAFWVFVSVSISGIAASGRRGILCM